MNTSHFFREVISKLKKYKIIILAGGIIIGALLFLYAKTRKIEYTAKATVFPLSTPSESALSAGSLSSLLGISDAPKSFSSEASINIIELATSRNVRQQVAGARLPQFNNKRIAELIVDEKNKTKGLLGKKIIYPSDSVKQMIVGGELMQPDINAKMNKNGVLELYFTSTNEDLVQPVSEMLISKISEFYISLRIKKALEDYNFTLTKIDSLQKILGGLDNRAIGMQNTTFFTPDLLQYQLPKENLSGEKQRTEAQRNMSINNREEALWRLQKITPIIQVLDAPTPPFDGKKTSSILMGILGFILGVFITALFILRKVIYRFAKAEIYKAVFGNDDSANTTAAV